jgi:hypothetical protein
MRVRCERTSFAGLSSRTQAVFGYGPEKGLAEPIVGREFAVVAIGFWEDSLWYYVRLDDELLPVPAALFSVFDGHLPADWVACASQQGGEFAWYACPSRLMVPTFEVFYSDLLEGQPDAHRLLGDVVGRV